MRCPVLRGGCQDGALRASGGECCESTTLALRFGWSMATWSFGMFAFVWEISLGARKFITLSCLKQRSTHGSATSILELAHGTKVRRGSHSD